MTYIYSFLQKRKMHEAQYGIIMVVIAYALSILMLVLGSDVFYNIKSAAAGINTSIVEETQNFASNKTYSLQLEENSFSTSQPLLVNPYNLTDSSAATLSTVTTQDTSVGEDTVWFLGSAMDNDAFDSIMGQMDSIVLEKGTVSDTEKVVKSKKDAESFSVKVASSNKAITVSQEEVKMLERIVEAEASGEDLVGKVLIANVIFNRIADEDFPDTVENVIFQQKDGDYQFSPVASDRYWSVHISDETEKAVLKALNGDDYSEGALYFIARKRTSTANARWFDRNLDWLFKHGGHEFYKNK